MTKPTVFEQLQIFDLVFIEGETTPLDAAEQEALATAKKEFERGEMIKWPFGK